MPLPEPRNDESKEDFIQRCMEDETMNEEYPREDQRHAVCVSQWEQDTDTRHLKAVIKGKDKEGIYSALASTKDVDRDGEVILPKAFKNLDSYLKTNPVIYYDHAWATFGSPNEGTLPIGKAVSGHVDEENGLYLSWKFSELPFAQMVKTLVDEGILNGVSVGFIPKSWDWGENNERVYTEVELLELSVVGIPANGYAQILRRLEEDGKQEAAVAVKSIMKHESHRSNLARNLSMSLRAEQKGGGKGRLRF